MRKPSVERLRELLMEVDGVLYWKAKSHPLANRIKVGEVAGTMSKHGYIVVSVDKVELKAHAIVWAIVNGSYPKTMLDHKNGVRHDNRIENLREADCSGNAANCKSKGATSTHLGVSFDSSRGRWLSQITKNGKNNFLGRFDSEREAALAYNSAAIKIHGRFARLNQI